MIGQTLLGRYTVESLVAEGGMGIVYRARDRHGGTVGIKRMRGDVEASAELLARFQREASVQAMLMHPNIATLHAVGATDDGGLFFVMELVEGEGLAEALKSGPLAPRRAISIAVQVLSALHYAHQMGLVHRDLKVDNILLAQSSGGGAEQAKVIDFGLVKLLGETFSELDQGLTADGALFGTPQYMAPEHIIGAPIDARTDLYAMGVLLFIMLTGQPPYDYPQVTDTWRAHLTAPVPSIAEVNPAADDPDLDAIVTTLLAKNPDERFDSARAARRALESVRLDPHEPQP
ncbi:MAG: serine/threonine protein kinase [Nannocystaceae bacterium]|nr:serine/threonine protein kinase [Nannocystaceae bacterium]